MWCIVMNQDADRSRTRRPLRKALPACKRRLVERMEPQNGIPKLYLGELDGQLVVTR